MTADLIRSAAAALRTRSAEAGQRYDGQVVLSQGEALAYADLLPLLADEHIGHVRSVMQTIPGPTARRLSQHLAAIKERADEAAGAILRGQS
jgi:hypothetical protein